MQNECNRRKTTGTAGLIQKSELNELVLEVVEERRKRREERHRNRWGKRQRGQHAKYTASTD